MGKSLCCFLLCFLVLFSFCSARQQNECSISRLNAQRPSNRIQSEAGVTEVFDHKNDQFQCAGVAVVRYIIEPTGLLLPSYVNAPQLMYIVQGRGLQGVLVTGCPETFQSFQESQDGQKQGREQQGQQGQEQQGQQEQQEQQQGREQQGQQQGREQQGQQGREQQGQQQGREQQGQGREQQGQQGQQFRGDQHQKIEEVREGDVFSVPTGFGHYIYNNGNRRLTVVSVVDISNQANQLDFQPRRFYLAGNPQNEFQQKQQQQQEQQQQGQQQEGREQQGREGQQRQQQQGEGNNIFSGFDAERLAEAFNVDVEIIRKLQGQNDRRGNIIKVHGGLQAVLPPRRQQEQQQDDPLYAQGNGYEETICSMKFRQNIGDPRRADVYTPRGGHRSSVTSYDLPVLRRLVQLSAHKGHLYQDAVLLPFYTGNANSIIYVIRGSARIQVVKEQGETVANEEIQEGQVIVVPQNFAALIKARDSGFEYVAFKTHENARINTLAGNLSLIRALPVQVIASAYQTSDNQARQLKHNRQESTIGAPGSASSRSQYRASA